MGTVALRLTAAGKRYGERTVLRGLDLDVVRGRRLVVLGPSGSGKSTLLRVLAGLDPLDAGELSRPDAGPGRDCVTSVAFQQPLLLPWLNVRDNVALGGRYRANRRRFAAAEVGGKVAGEARDVAGEARDVVGDLAGEVDELLARFGLGELAAARPAQLSGGQAQRVAIARAMAVRPDVLLLDEPFSALDPATRRDLRAWLRDTAGRLGLTLVLVTHDVDEALYLGQTVAALDGAGSLAGHWTNPVDPAHDELVEHPLRETLLASYRSQVALSTGEATGESTGEAVEPVEPVDVSAAAG